MKFIKKSVLCVLLCIVSFQTFAATYRHIYNNSNQYWYLYFDGYGFDVTSAGQTPNGFYILGPHKSYNTSFDSYVSGNLIFCDVINICNQPGRFTLNNSSYIYHNGNTGNITVNKPANGDIKIERDSWES